MAKTGSQNPDGNPKTGNVAKSPAGNVRREGDVQQDVQQEVVHSLDELGRAFAEALGRAPDADADSFDDSDDDLPGQQTEGGSLSAEEMDDAGARISPDSILEAILFVGSPSDEKMTARKLASLMRDVAPKEIKEIAARLNAAYAEQDVPYRIVSGSGNYCMCLDGRYEPVRRRIYGKVREATLSQASIDVLSVVAYNQPIARNAIEKMLAKPVQGILLQLVRRELLRVVTAHDKKRVRLYETTDRFLEVFGLEDYDDLPRSPDFDGQTHVE